MKLHLFFIFTLLGFLASSQAADLSDLTYTDDGTSVAITDCNQNATGSLVIPAQINALFCLAPYFPH